MVIGMDQDLIESQGRLESYSASPSEVPGSGVLGKQDNGQVAVSARVKAGWSREAAATPAGDAEAR